MADVSENPTPKRSGVEIVKENSRYLRGNIVAELNDGTDHVSKDSYQLLKFHGTYQQEDRDARKNRDKTGLAKHTIFMVRCKIPGGKLTAEQYLALDQLAEHHANKTLRLTTRQGIQFHGVLKKDLHATIRGINETMLTTLGACGDVERNVMCTAAPIRDGLREQVQAAADAIATHLAPRTRAYHEIWLNGKQWHEGNGASDDEEPIYGKTYLPRKFKTGIVLPDDNDVDIYAQDLGFVAIVEDRQIVGYNVLVGGGMGMTNGNPNTFPFLARPICYIPAGDIVRMAEAVVKLFRDHGNRADRKRARIKYVVADWGVPKFKSVLETYFGERLDDPRPVEIRPMQLRFGWHAQGDGRYFYWVSVENGRIKDEGDFRLRSALRTLVQRFRPNLRITPTQDLILCDLPPDARSDIETTLRSHGVRTPQELTLVQKLSMACPAIPTCGLAISESERALPGIIDQLEAELQRLGLNQEEIVVRMTGCPNGCARPYQSDIGIVGRSGDKYTLYVGGRLLGDRLNFLLCDLVPSHRIVPILVPLLEAYRQQRQSGEGFGDWCTRLGPERLRALLPEGVANAPHSPAAAS
ncbi:MAG: NADPH-dependent assimilatory sulfite reductase hemoprotein subunit [Gemmatales bacterium]|nr:NADPH-dependent assimilatory sulfite reductase hemoprotein subunit [Gemmatales bacterium]MDW8386370.1 NADPH-dependent assimilatory sulfite reductase hemoprotein subunit [Gemmatales bacterium]